MTPISNLTRIFLRIGCLSFGGPAAQIALMQTECVDRHRLIDQQSFLRALSFCMLLPGPEAMQLATYIGWQQAGVRGGLIAGGLFVLPGALVIAAFALIYLQFGGVPFIDGAFVGIQAVVVLIVVQALWRLGRKTLKGWIPLCFAGGAFASLYLFNLPFPAVIIAALLGGALWLKRTGAAAPRRPSARLGWAPLIITVLWLLPLSALHIILPGFYAQLASFFSQLAIVSFGGAYAVLSYMTQTVVQDFGWVTTDQMVDALGLAETTPGPLILVTQFVAMIAGHGQGGLPAALIAGALALWMTFLPCFLWIFAFGPYLDRLLGIPWLAGALAGVSAAVVGVIANLSIWFATTVYFTATLPLRIGPLQLLLPDLSSLAVVPLALAAVFALPIWRSWLPLPACLALAALVGAVWAGILS